MTRGMRFPLKSSAFKARQGRSTPCCVQFVVVLFFFFQAEDGIRDVAVTGVQTCALPICPRQPAQAGCVRHGGRGPASLRGGPRSYHRPSAWDGALRAHLRQPCGRSAEEAGTMTRAALALLMMAGMAGAPATTEPPIRPDSAHRVKSVHITVVSTMLADKGVGEWGFAAVIEADGHRLLFDTGDRPETVLQNARELGIDLSTDRKSTRL